MRIKLDPKGIQKSFYGKAQVELLEDGGEVLYSYGTRIATKYNKQIKRHWGGWSATTGRHIRAFCGKNKREFTALPLSY